METLREQLHIEVRVFGILERAPKGPAAPKPVPPRPAPLSATIPSTSGDRAPRPHDGSRTHLEPRIALPTLGDEPEEFPTAGRTFTLWETTSGLPDDSREEDERSVERHLRDLRGRVKRAHAVVATTPRLAETLVGDWRKAARFYARFDITESLFRHGVPPGDIYDRIAQESPSYLARQE